MGLLVETALIEKYMEALMILLEELDERLSRVCRESWVIYRLEAFCHRRCCRQRKEGVQSLPRGGCNHYEGACVGRELSVDGVSSRMKKRPHNRGAYIAMRAERW